MRRRPELTAKDKSHMVRWGRFLKCVGSEIYLNSAKVVYGPHNVSSATLKKHLTNLENYRKCYVHLEQQARNDGRFDSVKIYHNSIHTLGEQISATRDHYEAQRGAEGKKKDD